MPNAAEMYPVCPTGLLQGAMPAIPVQTIPHETGLLAQQRRAGAIITVGKVLLWMDLILGIFVYDGLRAGSHLYLWWVIGEFILGGGLIAWGKNMRANASRRLAALSPRVGVADFPNEIEQQRRAS